MGRAAIAVLATAVALAGCTPRPAPAPPAPVLGALPSAAQIDAASAARQAAVRGLRAWARLSYESPEESRRVRQLLIAERPDRLRLELFSPFGAVFVLTAADGALAAWDRETSTVYRGAASAANLRHYIQVELPVDEAVALLLGTPPLGGDDAVVSADGDQIKLWWATADGARAAWFTPALEPLRYEQHAGDGRVLLRASYADYQTLGGLRVARHIGLELPQRPLRLGIALSDIEVNPPLEAAAFALATPSGSRVVDLDRPAP